MNEAAKEPAKESVKGAGAVKPKPGPLSLSSKTGEIRKKVGSAKGKAEDEADLKNVRAGTPLKEPGLWSDSPRVIERH